MADQYAIVSQTVSATGTVDFTSGSITETFSAAILLYSGFADDSADNLHGNMGIGFVAPDPGATSEEQSACFCAENAGAGAIPDTGSLHSNTNCIHVPDPTNVAAVPLVAAQYSATISGGVRLNFSVVSTPIKVTAILFAGLTRAYTDACTAVTTGDSEPVGGTTDFRPKAVVFVASDNAVNTDLPDATPNIGFAIDEIGVPQLSAYVNFDDATEPTDADGVLNTANAYTHTVSRVEEVSTVTAFTSTGFNHTASAGTPDAHYLALLFSGDVQVAVAHLEIDNATGQQTFSGLGFPPTLVIGMGTLLQALDTMTDGATASSASYFVTGGLGSRAITMHHQEGLTGTGVWNAHTRAEDVAILQYDHLGAIVQRATWVAATGDGFTLDFSVASQPGHMTVLAIGSGTVTSVQNETERISDQALLNLISRRTLDETERIMDSCVAVLADGLSDLGPAGAVFEARAARGAVLEEDGGAVAGVVLG